MSSWSDCTVERSLGYFQFGIGYVLLLILLFTNTELRRVGVPYLSEAASFTFPIMDVSFR